MNRDDPREDAISMLCFWWRYERGWLPVKGYPTECPSTMGWRASRQYDSDNGAFETDERGDMAERIGNVVRGIPDPWRTALYVLARNRATGVAVWSSARLPADEVERLAVVDEAVDKFMERI